MKVVKKLPAFSIPLTIGLLLLVSILSTPLLVSAENNYSFLPSTPTPTLDGNITNIEWQDAIKFDSTLNGQSASAYVSSNASNLYFGLNYSTDSFVQLNMTAPVNASIDYDPALNRTHDFLALQIDTNLDATDLGTEESPDDMLVYNQYIANASYDGYANGNTSYPIFSDAAMNATNNGNAALLIEPGVDSVNLGYEFTKPFASDVYDLDLNVTNILQFRYVSWHNVTANASFATAIYTEWFTVQVNATGTGFANAQPITTTSITVDVSSLDDATANTIATVMKFSGYNLSTITTATNNSIADDTTYVLFLGDGISTDVINAFTEHVRLGGTGMAFLSASASSASNSLAKSFALEYKANTVLNATNATALTLDSNQFNTVLPFYTGNFLSTDTAVNGFTSSFNALDKTNLADASLVLSQNYHSYDLFSNPTNFAYDDNGNAAFDNGETLTANDTLGIAFDLLKGGRAVLAAFNPLAPATINNAGTIPLFLRMLDWTSKQTHAVIVNNFSLSNYNVTVGDKFMVNANITDLFGRSLDTTLDATVAIKIADSIYSTHSLSSIAGGAYEKSNVVVDKFGWYVVQVTAFAEGYGYAQSQTLTLFVAKAPTPFNSLADINYIIFLLSTISVVVAAVFTYKKLA